MNPEIIKRQIEQLKLQFMDVENPDAEDWLLALDSETDLHEFLAVLVKQIENAKILATGLHEHIAELKLREDRYERRIDTLRQSIAALMDRANLSKVEMPVATLSVRRGQPQLIGDADPVLLPDELVRIKRELNRTAIKEALKAGREVSGFVLGNAPPQLTIRIK
jgi:hypothetical protein